MDAGSASGSRVFRFDPSFLAKEARVSKALGIALIVAMFSGFAYGVQSKSWVLAALGVLALVLAMWIVPRANKLESKLRAKKQAAALWFDSEGLHATTDTGPDVVPLTAISSVVLQRTRGSTVSVMMFLNSGAPMKWAGLDEMDAFTNEFRERLPPEQVKVAKWIHR